ncbi:hypothetical protein AB0H43_30805 [Hamadaea sp. NPDC050747]
MFRLLGPLAPATGDNEVAPATRKQRQMLAVLLSDSKSSRCGEQSGPGTR